MPVLIDESKGRAGNPWDVSFMAMFHMANDSGLFRTAAQLREARFVRDGSEWVRLEGVRPRQGALNIAGADRRTLPLAGGVGLRDSGRYVPLYEAKMVSFYDHLAASYETRNDDRGYRVLPPTSDEDHANPDFEVKPFYWVTEQALEERLRLRSWALNRDRSAKILDDEDWTATTDQFKPRSAASSRPVRLIAGVDDDEFRMSKPFDVVDHRNHLRETPKK